MTRFSQLSNYRRRRGTEALNSRIEWHASQAGLKQPIGKSGRGQPHSKTLPRLMERKILRQVLECGCPLPLSSKQLKSKHEN
jgi:hypothetical protein